MLYRNAQFAISSAQRFSVFRSVRVSKFEERPGKYNVEQIKIREQNNVLTQHSVNALTKPSRIQVRASSQTKGLEPGVEAGGLRI